MRSRTNLLAYALGAATTLLGVVLLGPALWTPPAAVAAPGPADFRRVIAGADAAVVHITTSLKGGSRPVSRDDNVGAGFIVDPSGLIVTNRHVVSGAHRIRVHVKSRGSHDAEVVGLDEATDVALLRVPLGGLPVLHAGDPQALALGQWVLAAGSPYQLGHSWSVGIVSGLGRRGVGVNPRGYENYIQTDAAANLGNSGGPLFTTDGRVVGVVTAILSRATGHQGITLAVPIDVVMQTVQRLRGGRSAPRADLGLRVRETRVGATGGLQVTRFDIGSRAQAAGLRVGDVIVGVGTTPVARSADLQRAVWARQASGRIPLVFLRGGRRLQVSVPLN